MHSSRRWLALACAFGALSCLRPAYAGTTPATCGRSYCVVDLGGPAPALATAVNDAGVIVGQAGGHAFLWRSGQMADLGTLPPSPIEDRPISLAFGLNAQSEVVGASGSFLPGPNDGLSYNGAFVYAGSIQVMLAPKQHGTWVQLFEGQEALGVNDAGVIVGADRYRGFVFSNGQEKDVLPAYRDSIAVAVNRSGEVVGYASNSDTGIDETIEDWDGARDPDTLGFDNLPMNGHAFSFTSGKMHDLGGTAAFAVNDAGTIVGKSGNRAAMWVDGRWST